MKAFFRSIIFFRAWHDRRTRFRLCQSFLYPELVTVRAPGRLTRQLEVVAEAAGLERKRPLQWIVASADLSAAWFLEDGDTESAKGDLAVAELAWVELGEPGC